ncbi:MAG TPA: hypothetical protein VF624_17040 [Tepidisphaeraceae bacterium]
MSEKLLQEIRTLVDTGRYTTLESFIEIGAFNQLALERGATPAEVIERGHRRTPAETDNKQDAAPATLATHAPAASAAALKKRPIADKDKAKRVDVIEPVTDEEAQAIFARLAVPSSTVVSPLSMPEQPHVGERIFGQVNRIFPFKLVCRWLTTTAAAEGQWPKYAAVTAKLADDAGTIGSLLDQWDHAAARERGGELSTALPRRKNNASLDRFLSQFVARITRASEISPGAVCQYDMARFQDSTLALTEQGVAFAKLCNPILDKQDPKSAAPLSDEEADFLITHIRKWVPTEWTDMKLALTAVKDGKSSPAELAATVRAQLPEKWTDSMVQTHISGVIARLSDIRLVRRTWMGRNVQYRLGAADSVSKFMAS